MILRLSFHLEAGLQRGPGPSSVRLTAGLRPPGELAAENFLTVDLSPDSVMIAPRTVPSQGDDRAKMSQMSMPAPRILGAGGSSCSRQHWHEKATPPRGPIPCRTEHSSLASLASQRCWPQCNTSVPSNLLWNPR